MERLACRPPKSCDQRRSWGETPYRRNGNPRRGQSPAQADPGAAGLWLWWRGPGVPDLDFVWRAYVRRFDLEHTFRFLKQTRGRQALRVRHPEQADRWTWLVLAAYTQLRLARAWVADRRLPWERPLPPGRLTPGRVR